MKRFHISIGVADLEASIADYSNRLGCAPDVVIAGRYARFRTETLNFTLSCKPQQPAGTIRHLGFEDPAASGFSEETDRNGIVWESFSLHTQNDEIRMKFGKSLKGLRP
jgi:hypothetical protein